MGKISCPKCRSKKGYILFNGKRKCSQCKYEFKPHRLPLYLTREQWKEIIRWFLLEQSSLNISLRTRIERKPSSQSAHDNPDISDERCTEGLFRVLSKWMKLILAVNGRIKENPFMIRDRNEVEEPRNNRYSGSSVGMVRSGPRSSMTLELKHFSHLSQEKYQLVLSSVLILEKLIPV